MKRKLPMVIAIAAVYPISDSSLNFMGKNVTDPFLLLIQPDRRWIFSDKISAIHPIEILLDTNDKVVVTDNGELVINPTS